MAILNRIINILILLAAIAAVVFSYLLFSKREKLVDGWSQMAKAVNTAAKTLDKDSGTTFAADLTPEKLAHTKYTDLGQNLPKLNEAATKVRDQRNDLADAMIRAGSTLSITNVKSEELKNVKNYKSQISAFLTGVDKFRNDRNSLAKGIIEILMQIKVTDISTSQLTNSKTSQAAIETAKSKAAKFARRLSDYEDYLKKFNSAMRFSAISLTGDGYRPNLAAALKKFQEFKREADRNKSDLAKAQRDIKNLKAEIDKLKAEKGRNSETIQRQNNDIQRLKNILDKNGSLKIPKKLLTPADKEECYPYVRGTVEYVDTDYGFITINIGSSFVFVQQYGTKQNPVHFPLEPGKIMTVFRNLESENPTAIGKVIVTKVEENLSLCTPVGARSDSFQVGDTVIFTPDDIQKALEDGKK